MKTQHELETTSILHDPCYPDSRSAIPALQAYTTDSALPAQRHDHILRAALLADDRGFAVPCKPRG